MDLNKEALAFHSLSTFSHIQASSSCCKHPSPAPEACVCYCLLTQEPVQLSEAPTIASTFSSLTICSGSLQHPLLSMLPLVLSPSHPFPSRTLGSQTFSEQTPSQGKIDWESWAPVKKRHRKRVTDLLCMESSSPRLMFPQKVHLSESRVLEARRWSANLAISSSRSPCLS